MKFVEPFFFRGLGMNITAHTGRPRDLPVSSAGLRPAPGRREARAALTIYVMALT